MPLEATTITTTIQRPLPEVYAFLVDPANWARWASGMGSGLENKEGIWLAHSPEGPVQIRFTPANDYGVLDHWVTLPGGTELFLPMRAIANGSGTELLFTLFRQEEWSDEQFAHDASWVLKDLESLRQLLDAAA